MKVERIGKATLYLGDCREIMPVLGLFDAVITDPPYGLGDRHYSEPPSWDKKTADDCMPALFSKARGPVVIWGGNYYELPKARCWLLWDKMQEHDGAHAEMAWTNIDKPVRIYRMARSIAWLNGTPKEHPTEKPTALMSWCIAQCAMPKFILDPFMGSGSTGVAAVMNDLDFCGIEMHEPYFDIACRRIENAQRQERLFA